MSAPAVIVSGPFDDLRSRHLRFLQEAAQLGQLTVLLWPDEVIQQRTGVPPKFPFVERRYFLNAVRYVSRVLALNPAGDNALAAELESMSARLWVESEHEASLTRRQFCEDHGLEYRVLPAAQLSGFPESAASPSAAGRKKVLVTGCYDWFHSGHVRFFEEVSVHGDLYVVVGNDANIRLLKGEGHPLVPQEERRYVVASIEFVQQALIATGQGWLDADPEIRRLQPDIYAVNEDGDRGGKREYCVRHGLEYLVLKRTPAPGLPRRTSTDLRGF